MPAAAWAARSGDPVLFAGRDEAAGGDRRGAAAAPEGARLRARPLLGDLLRRACAKSPRSPSRCSASPARTRSPTRSPSPATRDGGFGWNVNDPGHGFVVARSDSPLDAAAAAPLSASGTWGPLLLTDDADTLPAALRDYLLDVKPGYTDRPDPRLLQPRLGDRRPGGDRAWASRRKSTSWPSWRRSEAKR